MASHWLRRVACAIVEILIVLTLAMLVMPSVGPLELLLIVLVAGGVVIVMNRRWRVG
jgi:hypothetical protein